MKKSIAIIAAILLLGGLTACSASSASSSSAMASSVSASGTAESSSSSTASSASVLAGEDSIGGNLNDATMNEIELMTADGHTFRFNIEGVTVEAGSVGLVLGESITVYYIGTLDESLPVQTVEVTKVVVVQ